MHFDSWQSKTREKAKVVVAELKTMKLKETANQDASIAG